MRTQTKIILSAAALLLAFGCSGTKDESTGTSQFTTIYNNSFAVQCASCHTSTTTPGTHTNLEMGTADSAYAGFMERVTRPSGNTTCTNDFRVVAGQPNKSYLLGLLFADYQASYSGSAGCTPPVIHLNGLNFTAAEKSAIVQWIQTGAAR
jgi:hypothetical protein